MSDQKGAAYIKQAQIVTRGMAYQAAEKAGLKQTDFDIKFRAETRLHWKIKGGPHPEVTLGFLFISPDFKKLLGEMIKNLLQVKRSTAVETRISVMDRDKWLKKMIPTGMQPRIEANTAYTVDLVRTVRVKHRKTGIIVTREAPENGKKVKTWSELVRSAKIEATELAREATALKVVDQEAKDEEKKANQPA